MYEVFKILKLILLGDRGHFFNIKLNSILMCPVPHKIHYTMKRPASLLQWLLNIYGSQKPKEEEKKNKERRKGVTFPLFGGRYQFQ